MATTITNTSITTDNLTSNNDIILGGGRTIPSTAGGVHLSDDGINVDIVSNGRTSGLNATWASLRIHPDAGYQGLRVVGDTGQTADCMSVVDSNGNPHFVINNNGYITKPHQPFFEAYANTASWGWSNSVLPFSSVRTNIGSHYSASTQGFTAPVTGTYIFTVRAMSSVSFGSFFWYLRINNSDVGYIATTDGMSQYESIQGTREVRLSANDLVQIKGSGTHSGMYASWFDNNFTGYLLG